MTQFKLCVMLLVTWAFLLSAPRPAHAAESYDNCTGFITSVPAVITTQGTWCMKSDLATALTSGNAITISTNNVTLDCNNFKLGDLAAGTSTATNGVGSVDRLNATVRHCTIRGFYYGIHLGGSNGGGHVIEDNRFDGNTYSGVYVAGDGSVVRRNLVLDTGGSTLSTDTTPIWTIDSVDIIDNTVTNSVATAGSGSVAFGLFVQNNPNGRIIGNGIRGILGSGLAPAYGIFHSGSDRVIMRGNDLIGSAVPGSIGISCTTANNRARDNEITGFATGMNVCSSDGGNVIVP